MRLLFCPVLIALTAFNALAQNLNTLPNADFTCYKNSDETFCFFSDGVFRWQDGGNSSFGKSDTNNKSITLTFEDVTVGFDIQVNETKANSKKDGNIEVRGIRSDGTPIKGITLRLSFSNLRTETNENGIARLYIPDSVAATWNRDLVKIYYQNIGTNTLIYKYLNGFDHLIAVVLDQKPRFRSNEKVTFSFQKKGDTIFIDNVPYQLMKD